MKPVFGYGLFSVSKEGEITESIVFEYFDKEMEYARLLRDEELLYDELVSLRINMQGFLDEEIVKINGIVVRPYVVTVNVGLSGSPYRPFINYIIKFRGELRPGINVYENYYEPERADYDYIVTWVFPEEAKVLDADVGVEYVVRPQNVLTFRVRKGHLLPGSETISFLLPERSGVAASSIEEEF